MEKDLISNRQQLRVRALEINNIKSEAERKMPLSSESSKMKLLILESLKTIKEKNQLNILPGLIS